MMRNCVDLISVIMPVFNAENTLAYAIESVLSQTHPELELLVIDDASEDDSAWIAEHYARIDHRIRILYNSQNSRSHHIEWEPRNDAMEIARGHFIAYLDADNTWESSFLAEMRDFITADSSLQLAYCDSRNFYSEQEKQLATSGDTRTLVDQGSDWTIFSNEQTLLGGQGTSPYIDTNEMFHRATIFDGLLTLWRTEHPFRAAVNARQPLRRPYRRHNDLDLAERVMRKFGTSSIGHLRKALVNYYYQSARRSTHPTLGKIPRQGGTAPSVWLSAPIRLPEASPKASSNFHFSSVLDLRLAAGDLTAGTHADLPAVPRPEELIRRLSVYPTPNEHWPFFAYLAHEMNDRLECAVYSRDNVVPSHGCTDAIGQALRITVEPITSRRMRPGVLFAGPGYDYSSIARGQGCRPVLVRADAPEEFVGSVQSMDLSDVRCVILTFPHNPLGYTFSACQIKKITEVALTYHLTVVVDLAYEAFTQKPFAIGALAHLPLQQTVLCTTMSKTWGLPGLRVGFTYAANSEVAEALRRARGSALTQPAATLLDTAESLVCGGGALRDAFLHRISARKQTIRHSIEAHLSTDSGVTIGVTPDNSMFEVLHISAMCARLRSTPMEIASRLEAEHGILVRSSEWFVPRYWRDTVPHLIRISMGGRIDPDHVGERLAHALNSFRE